MIGEAAGWSDARPWAQPKATLAYSRGSETEFIALLEHWLVLNASLDGPNGLRELMQGCAWSDVNNMVAASDTEPACVLSGLEEVPEPSVRMLDAISRSCGQSASARRRPAR